MRFSLPWLLAVFVPAAVFAQTGTLVYSTNPQYPPYDWAVDQNAFDGASIELLSLVLPPGIKAQPLVVPWKRAMEMAKTGQVDLLLSLRITPEQILEKHLRRLVALPPGSFPGE